MTEQQKEQTRRWLENWERVGPVLEQERIERVRKTSTPEAVAQLSGDFLWIIRTLPRRLTSGLVQQQALFRRLEKR